MCIAEISREFNVSKGLLFYLFAVCIWTWIWVPVHKFNGMQNVDISLEAGKTTREKTKTPY